MARRGVTVFEKMFRGQTRTALEARLMTIGWPQPMAGLLASYLVGTGPMPSWPPFGDHKISATEHRAMAAFHTRLAELLEGASDHGEL